MDDKSKKNKKKKLKQKQKQKQQQSVVVNVNLAKSRKKSTSDHNPQNKRVQLPPPIHKVYASPIHDLTPQIFNKEGKQIAQPTLADQMNVIEKYLKNQEQQKQASVLGAIPQSFNDKPKEMSEMETQTEKTGGPGRKKGSKNNPKNYAVLVDEANVVATQAIPEKNSGNLEGWGPGERILIPRKFQQETTSLRVPEDSINTNPNIITNPSQTDESNFGLFKLFTPPKEKTRKTSKNSKTLVIEGEEEINEL